MLRPSIATALPGHAHQVDGGHHHLLVPTVETLAGVLGKIKDTYFSLSFLFIIFTIRVHGLGKFNRTSITRNMKHKGQYSKKGKNKDL